MPTSFQYPLDSSGVPKAPLSYRLQNQFRHLRDLASGTKHVMRGELSLKQAAEDTPSLSADDIVLVVGCRNSVKFLPVFLSYYRKLGVKRFAIIDDASYDGTQEFLLEQNDVDFYTSSLRYGDAARGKFWRNDLLHMYGPNRWFVNVDIDEFVLLDAKHKDIREACEELDLHGLTRKAALMLDTYPATGLRDAKYPEAGEDPWKYCDNFDSEGYDGAYFSSGLSIFGGARKRIFGIDYQLIKYPFIKAGPHLSCGRSIHQPKPLKDNFTPCLGAMIHLSIMADLEEKAKAAVADGQYFQGGSFYQRVLDMLADRALDDFVGPSTHEFQSVEQLEKLGLTRSL